MTGAMALTSSIEEPAMVTFGSYNSTGMDIAKIKWIKDIIIEHEIDFFAVQEHFKNTKTTQKYFSDHFSDKRCFVTPAVRAPGQTVGRCAGGLLQLSDKSLTTKIDKLAQKSFRIQAQILHISASKILWVTTYLPNDPGPASAAWDETELLICLAQVESLLTSTTHDEIVWAGDLNWDMGRNTRFATIVSSFMDRLGLVPVWSHFPVDYTHIHTDYKSTSTLDHFIVSPRLLPLIEDSRVIHRGDNRSRHSPIILKMKLGNLEVRTKKGRDPAPRRCAWSRATEPQVDSYTKELQKGLETLQVPDCLSSDPDLCCKNPHCKDKEHSRAGDGFLLDIISIMVETSHHTIPMSGGGNTDPGRASRGGLPGWKEEVEPYRLESVSRHKQWLEQGRPSTGHLHQNMVRSRTQYHHAIRRIKRKEQEIRSRKLLDAAMAGDMNLLKEMKNIQGKGARSDLPETVEGAETEESIAEKFKEVYEALYNSAESNTDSLK